MVGMSEYARLDDPRRGRGCRGTLGSIMKVLMSMGRIQDYFVSDSV